VTAILAISTYGTIAVGIATAFVGGFLCYVAYGRYQRRVRVSLLRKGSPRSRDFVRIYCDLIHDEDQIEPECILKYVNNSSRSPRNALVVRWAAWRNVRTPLHFVLLAYREGQVIGFINAIYLPAAKTCFIAYVGAERGGDLANGRVIMCMLRKLSRLLAPLTRRGLCDWAVYELTHRDSSARRMARFRLFRNYAQSYGLNAYRVGIPYYQPDMAVDDYELTTRSRADLVVVPLDETGARMTSLPILWVHQLVESIYIEVYLASWHHRPELTDKYKRYLKDVADRVTASAPDLVPLQ